MSKFVGIEVSFSYGENPCLHIKNSHLLRSKDDIKRALAFIRQQSGYDELRKAGYTRTAGSEYREWRAHNFLYRLGIARERTGSVDIDQNESKLRRFIYAVLSIF